MFTRWQNDDGISGESVVTGSTLMFSKHCSNIVAMSNGQRMESDSGPMKS